MKISSLFFATIIGGLSRWIDGAQADNNVITNPSASVLESYSQSEYYFGGNNISDNQVYFDWLLQTTKANSTVALYDKSTFLSSNSNNNKNSSSDDNDNRYSNGVAIHWRTDATHLYLAVAGKAAGWMGFGIAEAGAMYGADIVLFTAETNELIDSYVLNENVSPFPDECQSWNMTNSVVQDGFLIFEANRLLDTGDWQDRVIANDAYVSAPPNRIIAAWGDSAEPSYHGLDNVARGSIRFFGNVSDVVAFNTTIETEAEGSFFVGANNSEIPTNATYYGYFCVSDADLSSMGVPINQSLHTIAFEPIVDPRARQYVHHYIVSATNMPYNSQTQDCENEFPGFEQVYLWAPGELPYTLPSNAGSPLGGTDFRAFQIQIHYNNPSLDSGVLDSSGVRFYYTSKKRQYDLGIFTTGDPNVELQGQQVAVTDGDLAQHSFGCPSTCSTTFLSEPVTVVREHLHMHMSGQSMVNQQIRNGNVIREATVQYWDFEQQGGFAVVQAPYNVSAGDSFQTICNYNPPNNEIFGLGSNNEMCIAFLYYYPRTLAAVNPSLGDLPLPFACGLGYDTFIPPCASSHDNRTADASMLFRVFGPSPQTCPASSIETPASSPIKAPMPNQPTNSSGGSVAISSANGSTNVVRLLALFFFYMCQ